MAYSDENQPQDLRDYLNVAATSPAIARVRAAGLSRWELDRPAKVLDAGCGNGEFARDLAALLPGVEVSAVDHSPDAIAEATRRHDGSRVTYEVGDLLNLPYADGQFDGVRSERVLQHLTDHGAALAELVRVTRPGGRICLIDTDWESLLVDGSPAGIDERTRALKDGMAGYRTAEAFTAGRRLRRWMAGAGVSDVEAEPLTLAWTDLAQANRVLPFQRDSPLGAAVPALGAFCEAVDRASADGTLLITLTMWVAAGTKPSRSV